MKYAVEMTSGVMIHIPNFTTINSVIRVMYYGYYFNNCGGYSVGITDVRDL
jgi:hypothetical protein